MRIFYFLIIILAFTSSCKTTKPLTPQNETVEASVDMEEEEITSEEEPIYEAEEYTEERTLPELSVTAQRGYTLPKYNPSEKRDWDIIHTDLDVRFDWTNEHVFGRAEITMKPFFYAQESVTLDAKGFDIIDIADESGKTLKHEYNGKEVTIQLEKTVTRDQEITLTFDYTAKPSEGSEGGSAAITSDKGLFFINPRGEEIGKPKQIWTQGETEHNSRWFPTIDHPNERMTHDIHITVDENFVTLSNGALVDSKSHINNTRTDHWKMDQPHAPYLVMIAVGEFAVVKEEVDGIELAYYVEKEYEPYAKQIFNHTPEMIRYFSNLLEYPYPWNKYSQIITRDYVSGAMENTTAVIFGDFIQKTDRELIDNDNDFIVAHELFHHWFGDLVTVESWANLTLQEGFANYSEHLWQEYKYGKDAAGFQREQEKKGYLGSIIQSGIHPLIHYGYNSKEDMFDGHSYNKGGLVLHMLRNQIGDEAFFKSLKKYLNDNKYSAVEVDELRMAFEDVTGEVLNWFFDQWYHEAGHPELELAYDYNSDEQQLTVKVSQTQDPEESPAIFQLSVRLSVFDSLGKETQFDIFLDERDDEIELAYDMNPALIVFDRDDQLLAVTKDPKSTEEYINQYNWMDAYIHRYKAISKIKSRKAAQGTVLSALDDNHFSIRKIAVENVKLKGDKDLIQRLQKMATDDPHSVVRGAAIKKLRGVEGVDMVALVQGIVKNEQAYQVIGAAIETLNFVDKDAALAEALKLKGEKTSQLTSPLGRIFASTGDQAHLDYFQDRLTTVSLFTVFGFYNSYFELLSSQSANTMLTHSDQLREIALTPGLNMFYKYCATSTLSRMADDLKVEDADVSSSIKSMVEEIKSKETNEMLKQRYMGF